MHRNALAPLPPTLGRAFPALRAPRHDAALGRRAAALAAAPLVALAAAVAGLVYVFLLPVCGLASVVQGLASSGWALAKDLARGHRPARATRT
jgi:hypothetical protein